MSNYYRSNFPSGEMHYLPMKELEAKAKNHMFRTNIISLVIGFLILAVCAFIIVPNIPGV